MKGEFKIASFKDFFKKLFKRKSIVQLLIILSIIFLVTIVIVTRKTVTLVIDGKESTFNTYKSTVRDALENDKIPVYPKDKITPSLDSKISKKSTINIIRAVNVQVVVDGKTINIQSAEKNIDKMLVAEKITVNDKDKVIPAKDTNLSNSLKVEIIRVEKKTFVETSTVSYNTVVKSDSNLANTIKKTIQTGANGEKCTTTEVTYEDGKAVASTVVNETITKKPVEQIVAQGTLPVLPISRGGDAVPYNKVFKAKATAYHAINGVGNTYSASGRKAVRDPNGYSTIAVDPSVIPLGSRVFVEGYGFAYAADTGTAIKGNIIDVFFNTLQEANNWAVKYVNVYVLK